MKLQPVCQSKGFNKTEVDLDNKYHNHPKDSSVSQQIPCSHN